jgi:hypothetical protein
MTQDEYSIMIYSHTRDIWELKKFRCVNGAFEIIEY